MFSVFRMGPDADCVIPIEYYSQLLNLMAEHWKSLHDENIRFNYTRYIFAVSGLLKSLTRDFVTSKNTSSISHSSRPMAAGPIQNSENMKSLLHIPHKRLCHKLCDIDYVEWCQDREKFKNSNFSFLSKAFWYCCRIVWCWSHSRINTILRSFILWYSTSAVPFYDVYDSLDLV